jgi:hypothetical protein
MKDTMSYVEIIDNSNNSDTGVVSLVSIEISLMKIPRKRLQRLSIYKMSSIIPHIKPQSSFVGYLALSTTLLHHIEIVREGWWFEKNH